MSSSVPMVTTYLNQSTQVHRVEPEIRNPDPGYYEYSESPIEDPDQEWGYYDDAEYPDQALLCPDYPEYPGEHYPGDDSQQGTGFEY